MRALTIQPFSVLAGALLALVAFVTMAQKPTDDPASYEYQILIDVEGDELKGLAKEGWEYVGYLGESKKGAGSDESLWRRLD